MTLTRSDLLSLSGHASPIPAGGLLGLGRRRAHPTLLPEEDLLDDLRPPAASSSSPTDEFAFVPQADAAQSASPPEDDDTLPAEITYTPLPEHPVPEDSSASSDEAETPAEPESPRPSQVATLPPAHYGDEDSEPGAPSLEDLPGRPPEPVPTSGHSLGDSFDDDFFSDEVERSEPEWELPPPTDETSSNEPGLGDMFDGFGPNTDEVPTTIDQSWATQERSPVEPETVQSQPDPAGLSPRDDFQPERVDPSITDYGNQKRRQNRMLLVLALAAVFLIGVPLIAFATLTVLQNQEGQRRKAETTPVPGQTMADALTPEPDPPEEKTAEANTPEAPAEPAPVEVAKSEVSVETPETAPEPPPKPAPKPKPVPRPKNDNTISAGWNTVNSDPAAAAVIFQKVLDVSPRNADARYGLGYAMLQAGDSQGALPHLCRARSLGGVEIEREVTGLLSTKGLACP